MNGEEQPTEEWSCISVVIPARNAASTLGQQLRALAAQDYDGNFEVLVVDNSSTDGTADVARLHQESVPRLRVIPATERSGVNYARNVGVRAAHGEAILICDADDVVTPGWVRRMTAALRGFDAVGGPMQVMEPCNDRVRSLRDPSEVRAPPMGFLPSPYGGNCGVRAEVFEQLGGFDERYAGGSDAEEFFWRLQLRGFRFGIAPDALIHYRLRDSVPATLKQQYIYAKTKPLLYKRFRAHGITRPGLLQAVKPWAWLVINLPVVVLGSDERRLAWLRSAAKRAGFLAGSVRHRALYL